MSFENDVNNAVMRKMAAIDLSALSEEALNSIRHALSMDANSAAGALNLLGAGADVGAVKAINSAGHLMFDAPASLIGAGIGGRLAGNLGEGIAGLAGNKAGKAGRATAGTLGMAAGGLGGGLAMDALYKANFEPAIWGPNFIAHNALFSHPVDNAMSTAGSAVDALRQKLGL